MNTPVAELITIGDEILYGQILDTNSQWMCQELDEIGIKVKYRVTVGDNREDILAAFQTAQQRSGIVLITGGLGPTPDDLTKPLLAEFFNTEVKENKEALVDLQELFSNRGYELTPLNRLQASLPENCTFLSNKTGTAPGMWFEEKGVIFVSMPGVPHEMKYLMEHEVIPRVRTRFSLPVIFHKVVKTAGIGESWLADLIADWEKSLPDHVKLAYLPTLSQVKLRLTVVSDTLAHAKADVEAVVSTLLPIIEKYVYGYDQETLEEAVGKLLKEQQFTLATAESCTGGYVSHLITTVPGSSEYFLGGVVSYDNQVKIAELGVRAEDIEKYGAVSEEVVIQMAEGVRNRLKSEVGVAISGVAGPGGGSPEKPVGTVWLACSVNGKVKTKLLNLGDRGRLLTIKVAGLAALNLIRITLIQSR